MKKSLKGLVRIVSILAFLSLMTLTLTAQPPVSARTATSAGPDWTDIDAYVESQLAQTPNPGLAYAIVHGNEIVHLKGFGVADSSGRPVTVQTPFDTGSISKTFTGLAIRQLVNAGRVEMDVPVQQYLPWFHLADADASAHITVRHLIEQTSGLPRAAGDQAFMRDPRYTTQEMVRRSSTVKLNRPVGSSPEYSNLNYLVLGLVVEKVSGQPYTEYVQQHILKPLKMQRTFFSQQEAEQEGLATGYQSRFGPLLPLKTTLAPGNLPAGGIMSTAEDMAQYLVAFLNDGRFEGISVTDSDGTVPAALHAGASQYHDIHWNLKPCPCENISEGQSGASVNYNADLQILPGKKWGVVVLMNSRFMLDGVVPSVTAMSIASNVSYLLQDYRPDPTPSPSYAQIYLIIDLTLLMFAAFSLLQLACPVVSLVRGRQNQSRLRPGVLALLDLVLGLGILAGFPLLVSLLATGQIEAGYGWDLVFYAFPDVGIVLLGSGVILLLAATARAILIVRKLVPNRQFASQSANASA